MDASTRKLVDTPTPDGIDLLCFAPVGRNLMLEVLEVDNPRTKSGIYMPITPVDPDTPEGWKDPWMPPSICRVLASGSGCAKRREAGSYVLCQLNAGVSFVAAGARIIILDEDHILAEKKP